jgi:hypothetical protein
MAKIGANLVRESGLKYVPFFLFFVFPFQRWSRGKDKECKLFCSLIPCNQPVTFFQMRK